ncbi:bacterial extracellular solute-binding protein, family 3 [Colletotrichum orchidophilum]|uniref:Bacterial extracellular solute-binding protein, family 3 n=1 Tax=Colletotrichum orchidophilum TaxID=1209926 RepID=A0A1G4BJS4_9PEZI|nr:bacterial extracellular solute-binding protein, family 3 [Colletotrichum orchidophilum]OHF01548.1 bacterial extracellular solute-binding protein, family 3 [Colletotrichum orchidophilum]
MVNIWTSALLGASALSTYAGAQQHGDTTQLLSYANVTSLLDTIIARGYMNVGTTGDYKPFTYLVTNQTTLPNTTAINTTYIGADIDAAQSLSNALGLPKPPRLVATKWANITSDLSAGKFDIAMGGVSLTLARAKTAFFSTAIQRVGKTACIRCADADKYTDLASLDQAGVKVAVNPGGTNEAFDRANLKSATIVMVEDNNAVYQAVLDGSADAMISDLIEVELQVKLHEGELCIANPDEPFNFEELAYAVPRDIVWKHFVDAWVHVQLGSGGWNGTLEKWLNYKWPSV